MTKETGRTVVIYRPLSVATLFKTLTVCIDEDYEKCNQEGKGEALFKEDGESSEYLAKVIEFLQEFQGHSQYSELFCKTLSELDLLEPMGASFKTPDGKDGSLNGFYTVNREKLKELPAEKLQEFVKNDMLELVYLHLSSLKNLNNVIVKTNPESTENLEPA